MSPNIDFNAAYADDIWNSPAEVAGDTWDMISKGAQRAGKAAWDAIEPQLPASAEGMSQSVRGLQNVAQSFQQAVNLANTQIDLGDNMTATAARASPECSSC